MAVTTRRKPADDQLAGLRAELAGLRAELARMRAVAQVAAHVAAKKAPGPWTDFRQMLTVQYGIPAAAVDTFMDVMAGREP